MPDETELEQLSSDLQALKRLYGLLHKGPANENVSNIFMASLVIAISCEQVKDGSHFPIENPVQIHLKERRIED